MLYSTFEVFFKSQAMMFRFIIYIVLSLFNKVPAMPSEAAGKDIIVSSMTEVHYASCRKNVYWEMQWEVKADLVTQKRMK